MLFILFQICCCRVKAWRLFAAVHQLGAERVLRALVRCLIRGTWRPAAAMSPPCFASMDVYFCVVLCHGVRRHSTLCCVLGTQILYMQGGLSKCL